VRTSPRYYSGSLRVGVFAPKHSLISSTPWTVFQDGTLRGLSLGRVRREGLGGGYITDSTREARYRPPPRVQPAEPALAGPVHQGRATHKPTQRFPCGDFEHSFTLFTKFFSPFDHSTCSLSVFDLVFSFGTSLRPALASSPKEADSSHRGPSSQDGIGATRLSRSLATRSWALDADAVRCSDRVASDYNVRPASGRTFQRELLPLQSPLLGESSLVSLPRLS